MSETSNENSNIKTENSFKKALSGDALKSALDLMEFFKSNEMLAGGEHGDVNYKGKCMCYMYINDSTQMPGPWTIWPEGDYSEEQEAVPMNADMKEIAWANVNFCTSCGCGSQPGSQKVVFGKTFDNVCNSAMAFYVPDFQTLECVKNLLLMRKNLIDEDKA